MDVKQSKFGTPEESAFPQKKDNTEENKLFVEKGIWAKVKKTIGKVPFLADAISLYYCAMDSKTPFKARAIAFSSLAYFILPLDIIPDTLLAVGYSDDAGVIAAAIMALAPFITEEHRRKAKDFLADRK
jgi:uncharacterized membrane protein YkvA (DUF1232 family)